MIKKLFVVLFLFTFALIMGCADCNKGLPNVEDVQCTEKTIGTVAIAKDKCNKCTCISDPGGNIGFICTEKGCGIPYWFCKK